MGGGVGGSMALGSNYREQSPGSRPSLEAQNAAGRIFVSHSERDLEEEQNSRDIWIERSAVLTPGDRVEFKVKMRKGETFLAGVKSDAFDPALAIVDSKGKELAKNDDREEGDQSPFLVYRFAEAGDYTVKVLSYRSVSGGKFTMRYRSFVSADCALGEQDHDIAVDDSDNGNRFVNFRFTAQKGQIYDLRHTDEFNGRTKFQIQLHDIVGPTGVAHNDYAAVYTPDDQPVFKALAAGDYYFEYSAAQGTRFHTDVEAVTTTKVADTCKQPIELKGGEIQIVEFPVKPNQIIRTAITGSFVAARLTAPAGKRNLGQSDSGAYGNDSSVAWFKPDIRANNDYIRIFHGGGTAQLAMRCTQAKTIQLNVENAEGLPKWEDGKRSEGKLSIGQSKLFVVDSTKSELMHVSASAKSFLTQIEIFRLDGGIANSLSNRQTLVAGDDLYFPDAARFVIRLSCVGDGGSGDFDMERRSLKASRYALNQVQDLKLDGANFGLYNVSLEAGKRYEFIYDLSDDRYLSTDLLDEDGQFLVSASLYFGSVVVQYFVPSKSGNHRLWLRGQPGSYKFRLSLHVPPKVDGKG